MNGGLRDSMGSQKHRIITYLGLAFEDLRTGIQSLGFVQGILMRLLEVIRKRGGVGVETKA